MIQRATIVLVAVAWMGCDRTHMSSTYGRAVRHALHQQVADPTAGERAGRTEQGLDPEEAATVLETYRKGLSPLKDASAAKQAPVLIVPAAPPTGAVPR